MERLIRSVIEEEEVGRRGFGGQVEVEGGLMAGGDGVRCGGEAGSRGHRRKRSLSAVAEANRIAEDARETEKSKAKRKRTPVEDMQDGSPEGYERRLHLNRQSAAAARVRRDTYIKALETSLSSMEQENIRLEDDVASLRAVVARMRGEVEKLNLKLQYSTRSVSASPVSMLAVTEKVSDPNETQEAPFQFLELDKDATDPMLQHYIESYPSTGFDLPMSQGEPGAPGAPAA
mmetsp:Transcript_2193/g.4922  ORF Transcript_2193/g.4922 Transcript_2193/m.4922 type:complete len:232 (-) Transcript_2193:128-823(-)